MRTLGIFALLLCAFSFVSAASVTVRAGELGKGDSCLSDPEGCAEPLSCVGTEKNMRCFEKRDEGEKCGKDPFWVCKDGLVCNKKICAVPGTKGTSCNLPTDKCIPPLECVGTAKNSRCFEKRGEGEKCGKDPFWVCKDGLKCVDNVCEKAGLAKKESCNLPTDFCEPPLECVGVKGNMRCFEKRDEGEKCGKDPFWVCKDGLVCNKKICAVPGTKGTSCNLPTDKCIAPLECVGVPGNMRCFEKRDEGEKCGKDPFWQCKDGLVCNKKICAKPGTKGTSCNLPTDKCIPPLECVGTAKNSRCFEKRGEGEKCGKDPFWVCKDGLKCVDNVCEKAGLAKKESCNLPTDFCEPPLECVGVPGNMRCFEKRDEGEKCGKDPFWVCKDGLVCNKKICAVPGTKGTSCNLPTDKCIPPLMCVGTAKNKRCFEPRDLGEKCGKDPFWVCKDGLVCVRNVCEKA